MTALVTANTVHAIHDPAHWLIASTEELVMPVVRQIWDRIFATNTFPGLPCPNCAPGKIKLVPSSLSLVEPAMSLKCREDETWEPDNVVERWTARMQCDEANCGEIMHMIGDTTLVETFVEEVDSWGLETVLRVKAAFPAPPLFRPPNSVPHGVKEELDLAFQLFWSDTSASLGRLRTAVEKMLDDQKVPREGIDKNGDIFYMKLNDRINAFAKHAQGADAHAMLQGLRNIGNMGAHGNEVTLEDLFDAVDVLEDVLLGIYENGSIKAKAQKLLSRRTNS